MDEIDRLREIAHHYGAECEKWRLEGSWQNNQTLGKAWRVLDAELQALAHLRESRASVPTPSLRDTENERLRSFLEEHPEASVVYTDNKTWLAYNSIGDSLEARASLMDCLDAAEKQLEPSAKLVTSDVPSGY